MRREQRGTFALRQSIPYMPVQATNVVTGGTTNVWVKNTISASQSNYQHCVVLDHTDTAVVTPETFSTKAYVLPTAVSVKLSGATRSSSIKTRRVRAYRHPPSQAATAVIATLRINTKRKGQTAISPS